MAKKFDKDVHEHVAGTWPPIGDKTNLAQLESKCSLSKAAFWLCLYCQICQQWALALQRDARSALEVRLPQRLPVQPLWLRQEVQQAIFPPDAEALVS